MIDINVLYTLLELESWERFVTQRVDLKIRGNEKKKKKKARGKII